MTAPRLPKTIGTTSKYRNHILSFGVTLAAGMAPLLGKVHVPFFTAILDVFPLNLSSTLIPFVAFIMTLPAVAVQFFAKDAIAPERLDGWFRWNLAFIAPLTMALYVAYTLTVTQINFEGQKGVVAYVTGSNMLPTCPCATHRPPLAIASCIGNAITFDPAQVSDCYPPAEINSRKAILSTLYMMLMLSFGTLIGLLVLKEEQRRKRRRRKRRQ
jgi:hypothetical protein